MIVRPRVIPVLQLSEGFLVKTTRFTKPRYLGDPINAVKIFNDKQVDELILCDIEATAGGAPRYELLESIASEAFMPLGYGGGISTLDEAKRVLALGFEKIVINSAFGADSGFVRDLADTVGAQSVLVSVDVKRGTLGRHTAHVRGGRVSTGVGAAEWARRAAQAGAGEILLHSIDRDGAGTGYDIEMIRGVSREVDVPVIALGGAASMDDFSHAMSAGASAVAASSYFVFHGKRRAVLITYPSPSEIARLDFAVSPP